MLVVTCFSHESCIPGVEWPTRAGGGCFPEPTRNGPSVSARLDCGGWPPSLLRERCTAVVFFFFSLPILVPLPLFCLHIIHLIQKPQVDPLLSDFSSSPVGPWRGTPPPWAPVCCKAHLSSGVFYLLPWVDTQPLNLGFKSTSTSESWLGFLRLKCKVTMLPHTQ